MLTQLFVIPFTDLSLYIMGKSLLWVKHSPYLTCLRDLLPRFDKVQNLNVRAINFLTKQTYD